MATKTAPTLADVEAARERLAGKGVRVTPVYSSETFTRRTGRPVLLKAENLQRTGSFKVRGAVNKMESLSEAERRAGVVTASAGNHGQAVAWAAREEGIEATVFMPSETPMTKVERDPELRRHGRAHRPRFRGRDARGVRARRAVPERRSSMPSRIPLSSPARGRSGSSSRTRSTTSARWSFRSAAAAWPRESRSRCAASGPASASSACRRRRARHSQAGAARLHDRRRHRRQAARRADLRARQGPARRGGDRQRRGDQPGDRAAPRTRQARRRGCRRRSGRGAALRSDRRDRPGDGAALRRQHRPDAADPGHAPRAHALRPLPRRPNANLRPARES